MDTESTPSFPDLQSILNGTSNGDNSSSLINTDGIVSSIVSALMPMIIVMTVVTALIAILYILNIIQRFRVDRATIETRNILREMNERDKARNGISTPTEKTPEPK